ncbi:MAG: hypothetical protein JWN61_3395 [Pseudonocardiales bacterium]|nr:hypothetical protein [Pseudonocardiales bacterium]
MKVSRLWISFLSTLALGAGGMVAMSVPAQAAPQVKTAAALFSGSANPNITFTTTAVCDECYPDAVGPGPGSWAFGASATTEVSGLSFAPASTTAVSYDDSLLRQGQTMPITDILTPLTGTMTATGQLTIDYGVFNDPVVNGTNFVPSGASTQSVKAFSLPFLCNMPLPGDAPANCSSGVVGVPVGAITVIPQVLLVPGLDIVLSINVSVNATITGDGVVTLRSAQVIGGASADTASLTFGGTSPSTQMDGLHFSCLQPAGNNVQYSLTALAYSPDVALSATTAVHFEGVITDVIDTNIFGGDLGSLTSLPAPVTLPLMAADQVFALGPLAKNNIPPVVNAGNGGAYSGSEGQAVAFDGSGSSSVCGFPTLRWDFSDKGVEFGAHPAHTFTGAGLYSGQLTATDATGLTSSTTFSVTVANVAPVADAGPNVGAAWGIPVALNGSATDPGTDDQRTLSYRWDFGDGTPSATGGPRVMHAYGTPGVYTASFRACDRYDACTLSTASVTIRQRDVTAAYLGDHTGTYNTAGTMTASLTDEFGSPVQGRVVSFQISNIGTTLAAGSASTSNSGIATRSLTPLLDAGLYTATVAFTGDSLYTAAPANSASYTESVKATVLSYTGALSGGPNKTVTLSAVLKDATGLPLANKTVTFTLGTQTATATSTATGIASTSLKLSQKNAKYLLTATYAPVGADANHYAGTSTSTTFTLQAK